MKSNSCISGQNSSSCVLSQNAFFTARRFDAQFYYYYRFFGADCNPSKRERFS